MDLAHPTYPEAEPTGFFPEQELTGGVSRSKSTIEPSNRFARLVAFQPHNFRETCVFAPKTPIPGTKTWRKAQFYRALAPPDAIDRRRSNRQSRYWGPRGSLGRFRRGPVEFLGQLGSPESCRRRPASKDGRAICRTRIRANMWRCQDCTRGSKLVLSFVERRDSIQVKIRFA
jgi:hypothetical protein